MGKGVQIGLSNVVVAELLTDEIGSPATYEAPVRIPGAMTANVNPNTSTETLFADDGPYETATTIGGITLSLNVADLDLATQAKLFGHTMTAEGVLIRKSGDTPPWVAVGFKSLKSNGKYRYTWLAKGKFGLPEQNNETKGDSVSFQTPTTEGSFVKRETDDEWERHIDEDTAAFTPEQATNWFLNPYGVPPII
jgi:phi13 family phage major tail protein